VQSSSPFEEDPERPSTGTPTEAALHEGAVGNAAAHDPYAALRLSDFGRFAGRFVIGTIGFQMQNVAVAWEVYQWTNSPRTLAWVGLCMAVPMILLTLPAGHLADRYDRRWVVFISLLCTASFAPAIRYVVWAQGHGQISTRSAALVMYALLFGSSATASCGRPARQALMPQIVPKSIFQNAVTDVVAGFIDRVMEVKSDEAKLAGIRAEVAGFAGKFPMPHRGTIGDRRRLRRKAKPTDRDPWAFSLASLCVIHPTKRSGFRRPVSLTPGS